MCSAEAASLQIRQQLRQKLRVGDVDGCRALLQSRFPQLIYRAAPAAARGEGEEDDEEGGGLQGGHAGEAEAMDHEQAGGGKQGGGGGQGDLLVHFWLCCQKYIELLR